MVEIRWLEIAATRWRSADTCKGLLNGKWCFFLICCTQVSADSWDLYQVGKSVGCKHTDLSWLLLLAASEKENKKIFGAETFSNTPHKTRKDPKGDDTFNLSGAAKSIQRGKNSRSRELSGAGVLTTSVVNNLLSRLFSFLSFQISIPPFYFKPDKGQSHLNYTTAKK